MGKTELCSGTKFFLNKVKELLRKENSLTLGEKYSQMFLYNSFIFCKLNGLEKNRSHNYLFLTDVFVGVTVVLSCVPYLFDIT